MQAALADAGLSPSEVQYVNAHATSTPLGDIAETLAIKAAFGPAAAQVAVSRVGEVAPPTINLQEAGEGCDLDYVPNVARPMKIDAALSNSFGFGGTNGSVLLRRYTG